jgi:GNAT superfamily N-acetyltransferase
MRAARRVSLAGMRGRVVVRAAVVEDAAAIGRVHVRAWQAAYRGQMPEAYLDGLHAEGRAAGWARGLARDRRDAPVLAADLDGRLVGFAAVGAAEEPAGCGELYALNVDPDHWGVGVGRALLDAACAALAGLGCREAVLWVLPGNDRARRLYARGGWRPDGARRTQEVLGVVVEEVRYGRRLDLDQGSTPGA